MKTLKYKGYCVVEITDDMKDLPFSGCFLHKTKKEAIESNMSYYGHPCDDPRKRGAVCEVEVTVKVPDMPKASDDLREYVEAFGASPVLIEVGNERWNNHAVKSAKADQRRKLKKLRHVS